ncbi:Uncharacterized protein TPAR_06128 [Tolypocladium paradoxum]|uniref:Uncharacterized protein n=1 Tax=Tolypocladium paradoxum TaxID=94208 RepID=A0A2S4KU09_9HYPO|nr:Uncharacterized protein TPAR_06128 [Tolypocladium paradoxum]
MPRRAMSPSRQQTRHPVSSNHCSPKRKSVHSGPSILNAGPLRTAMQLKQTTLATDRSLALYQEAIHRLLPHTSHAAQPSWHPAPSSVSWRRLKRHLGGCAGLVEASGINGFVGGVDEALFWCVARMDVCGGLISFVSTLIPVSRWASKTNMGHDVRLFRSVRDSTGWANYANLWIAGRCMSHPAERSAIVDLLDRIQRESGWGTQLQAEHLQAFWGASDE